MRTTHSFIVTSIAACSALLHTAPSYASDATAPPDNRVLAMATIVAIALLLLGLGMYCEVASRRPLVRRTGIEARARGEREENARQEVAKASADLYAAIIELQEQIQVVRVARSPAEVAAALSEQKARSRAAPFLPTAATPAEARLRQWPDTSSSPAMRLRDAGTDHVYIWSTCDVGLSDMVFDNAQCLDAPSIDFLGVAFDCHGAPLCSSPTSSRTRMSRVEGVFSPCPPGGHGENRSRARYGFNDSRGSSARGHTVSSGGGTRRRAAVCFGWRSRYACLAGRRVPARGARREHPLHPAGFQSKKAFLSCPLPLLQEREGWGG